MGVLAGGFVVAMIFWSLIVSVTGAGFLWFFMGAAVGLGVVYYFYVVWDNRPIRIQCPHCKGLILTNTPWVCGQCSAKIRNASDFPFVSHCPDCKAEPKTYRCHHKTCGKFIFLTEDEDETNYAFSLNAHGEVPKAESRSIKVKQQEEELHDKRHEHVLTQVAVSIAELDKKLQKIKEDSEAVDKGDVDSKRKSLKKHFDRFMAVSAVAREQKAENAEKNKNDPGERKRADKVVDDWVRRQVSAED